MCHFYSVFNTDFHPASRALVVYIRSLLNIRCTLRIRFELRLNKQYLYLFLFIYTYIALEKPLFSSSIKKKITAGYAHSVIFFFLRANVLISIFVRRILPNVVPLHDSFRIRLSIITSKPPALHESPVHGDFSRFVNFGSVLISTNAFIGF